MRCSALVTTMCALTFFALSSAANAQETTRAHLITRPDATDLLDAFPPIPLLNAVSGRAVLDCTVDASGDTACSATEEEPAGAGFAAAAGQLGRGLRYSPATENGRAVASHVRLPIVFANAVQRPASIAILTVPGHPGRSSNNADLSAYYPEAARSSGQAGLALIACATRSNGVLECALEREWPEGFGFGERALALMQEVPTARQRYAPSFRLNVAFHTEEYVSFYSEMPGPRDFERNYPRDALARGIEARTNPICEIQADRTVRCSARLDP